MEHSSEPSAEIPTSCEPDRRCLLAWISAGLGTLATAAAGLPIVGYFLAPAFRSDSDNWIDLGLAKDFVPGETRLVTYTNPQTQPWDGPCKKAAAYVRRNKDDEKGQFSFEVFAVNCAHLGCPVSWFPSAGLFLCPCHGGVYYEDGSYASGPPPRGLFRYELDTKDGHLKIKAGHLPTMNDPLKVGDKGVT